MSHTDIQSVTTTTPHNTHYTARFRCSVGLLRWWWAPTYSTLLVYM